MKLKELVPPLELCKLIPKGEFADSCFAWSYSCDKRKTEPFVDYREDIEFCRRNMSNAPILYPAPTLEEIMEKLPSCVCYRMNEEWSVGLVNDSFENTIKDSNGVTAALKLWLELKGIKYGK